MYPYQKNLVGDDAGVKVYLNGVPCLDGIHSLRAFHDGQADVDAVAVEDAGKAFGNDHRNACGLDAQGRVLTGRAAAKVPAAHHDITGLHPVHKVLVDILHAVAGKFLGILRVQVAGRDDDVGIHVIRVFENRTVCVVHG